MGAPHVPVTRVLAHLPRVFPCPRGCPTPLSPSPTYRVSWWVPRQRLEQYRAPQVTQVYAEGKPQTAQKWRWGRREGPAHAET